MPASETAARDSIGAVAQNDRIPIVIHGTAPPAAGAAAVVADAFAVAVDEDGNIRTDGYALAVLLVSSAPAGATRGGPHGFFRGKTPGLFLYVGATPGVSHSPQRPGRVNPGGLPPAENTPLDGFALCVDSYCHTIVRRLRHLRRSLPSGPWLPSRASEPL